MEPLLERHHHSICVRYGFTNLTAQHLAQFSKARDAAARFVSTLPRDLPVTAEPAHTFRASQEA